MKTLDKIPSYSFNSQDYPPVYKKWIDPTTGYSCMVRQADLGHLVGYVRVPRGHHGYRRSYIGRVERVIDVHGGVTFSGSPRRLAGGSLRGHWFGFDCAHLGDFVPALDTLPRWRNTNSVYRDVSYAMEQCTKLARGLQLLWSQK